MEPLKPPKRVEFKGPLSMDEYYQRVVRYLESLSPVERKELDRRKMVEKANFAPFVLKD